MRSFDGEAKGRDGKDQEGYYACCVNTTIMSDSAQSEGIIALIGVIIAVILIAIVAATYIFPAIGTATNQDTSWGGTLMILVTIGIIITIIAGVICSR